MDNNFYKILEIFKGLNESNGRDDVEIDGKQVDLSSVEIDSNDHFRDPVNSYISSAKFVDGTPLSDDQCRAVEDNFPSVVTDNLLDLQIDAADQHRDAVAHGDFNETFTSYWKGTDAGTPGKKMVGADESIEPTKVNPDGSWQQEGPWVKSTGKDPRGQVTHASDKAQRTTSSLEDRLRSQWEKTKREKGLQEYGMTTGGTQNPGAQDQADPAAVAKQTNNVQQGVNKLIAAGAPLPSGAQAVQSLMKDPATDPASQLDKTIDAGLGQEVQNIVTKGQPNDVNQLAALIKKVNQQSGV
jgi:hypothetical protein